MHTAAALRHWSQTVLAACGVPATDAAVAAEVLIRTNLRGIDTHGISRLPAYVAMLRAGEMNVRPDIRTTDQAGTLVMEADRALGQIAGMRAVRAGVEAAATRAVVSLSLRRTGHLGALGTLTVAAAERGMIAILMQNGPPIMGVPGASEPSMGNNPIAFSAPTAGGPPLVFDMATSAVAFGRIIDAARNKEPIPPGWALDETGAPTTDAAAALRGMLVPTGAFKGLGLSMLVEFLAGSLSGVHLDRLAPGRTLPPMFGAFLLVINPALLIGQDAFAAHRDAWIGRYKRSGPGMRYPGEHAAEVEAERTRTGIPLPASVIAQLTELGASVGVPWVAA